jgi:dCTP deaminase
VRDRERGCVTTYSDADIYGAQWREREECDNWLRIDPWDPGQVQPASVDLRLGTSFVCMQKADFVDMRDRQVPSYSLDIGTERDSYFELAPGQFALGATVERIELGPRLWAKIEGKSSLGRMGLIVHVTAGFVDPGFRGQLTLEFYNISSNPIRLRPGLAICQVAFGECVTCARQPYGSPGLGSRYQDQAGVVPVRV